MQRKPNQVPSTDRERYALDPTRRWTVKGHKGIRYRLSRSLERTYLVYWRGSFALAGNTLEEALVKQGELRKAQSRGETPIINTKTTFGELAEEWHASK